MSEKVNKANDIEYKTLAFDAQKTAIERIKKNGSKSIFKIIEDHAEAEETERRVDIIKKVIVKYNTLKKEVDGMKPDVKGTINKAGVDSGDTYSRDLYNSKKAKIQQMDAVVDAMESYEKDENFDKLDLLGKKKDA